MKLRKVRSWVPVMPIPARAVYWCPLCNWEYTVKDDPYGRSVRKVVRARFTKHVHRFHPELGRRERSLLSDRVVESPPLIREGRKRRKNERKQR
jgi:hypothetical protein